MNTRNKFHAWLITQGFRPDIAPITHNGTYVSSKVHELWECWQAAVASVEQQANDKFLDNIRELP